MKTREKSIILGKQLVFQGSMPYIIAEIGVNHEGSLELAKRQIELAKEGGAHAAKFQSYKANSLASIKSPAYWDLTKERSTNQHQLFSKYDSFGIDDYRELAIHCEKVGIDFVSTPFDHDAVDFLNPLVPYYKIASADLTNIPLIRKIASKGKPIILSTGASTLGEIDLAVETLIKAGCDSNNVALLHCILNYPTQVEDAHLSMIESLSRAYPSHCIGYSDHTLPDAVMTTLVAAHLLGALIIEKHFTHDKTLPGNDHYHAMDVNDLKIFFQTVKKIHELIGVETIKKPIPSEGISRINARRSLVLARDVEKGHVLSESDLICKRPGTGIGPEHWDDVMGKTMQCKLGFDDILMWNHIS